MTGKAIRSAGLLCWLLVLLALVATLSASTAHAADPQPVLVYQNPADGAVLQQPAFGIQLCFGSPVNIKDLDKGGDFAFAVTEPDGIGLGNRDVFQVDGYGITIYPGNPVGETAGQWKFHYRLTSPDAQSVLEGDINYTVNPSGSPVPVATPPPASPPAVPRVLRRRRGRLRNPPRHPPPRRHRPQTQRLLGWRPPALPPRPHPPRAPSSSKTAAAPTH